MVGGSLWVLINKLYTYLLLGRGRDRMVVGFTTTGKLYHLWLQVECTLFVIYKAGREPPLYW
jgi:hypothetical protein